MAEPNGDRFGFALEIRNCNSSDSSQIFTVESNGSGIFKIFSTFARVMEIRGTSAVSGAQIQQGNGFEGGDHQQFHIELQSNNSYVVRAKNSTLVWDLFVGDTSDGNVIVLGTSSNSTNQRWTLTKVP